MKFRYSEISKGGAYANVAEQKHQGKLQFFIGGGAQRNPVKVRGRALT